MLVHVKHAMMLEIVCFHAPPAGCLLRGTRRSARRVNLLDITSAGEHFFTRLQQVITSLGMFVFVSIAAIVAAFRGAAGALGTRGECPVYGHFRRDRLSRGCRCQLQVHGPKKRVSGRHAGANRCWLQASMPF
jgi:hypothetical protein